MRSVLGYNEKPNCLVIDEIDGAPAVSDELLPATCKKEWVKCIAIGIVNRTLKNCLILNINFVLNLVHRLHVELYLWNVFIFV